MPSCLYFIAVHHHTKFFIYYSWTTPFTSRIRLYPDFDVDFFCFCFFYVEFSNSKGQTAIAFYCIILLSTPEREDHNVLRETVIKMFAIIF